MTMENEGGSEPHNNPKHRCPLTRQLPEACGEERGCSQAEASRAPLGYQRWCFLGVLSQPGVGSRHHHGQHSVRGATVTPLGFLTNIFHKSHFKKISNQYSKVFFNLIFSHHLFRPYSGSVSVPCRNMCEELTGKEKMGSRKREHLANYQMNGSLLPRQCLLSSLTACHFHREALGSQCGYRGRQIVAVCLSLSLGLTPTSASTLLRESPNLLDVPLGGCNLNRLYLSSVLEKLGYTLTPKNASVPSPVSLWLGEIESN